MANKQINTEVQLYITSAIKRTVKETIDEIFKAQESAAKRNCFKEVERMLYSMPALEEKVRQDEEDLQKEVLEPTGKSKSIVRFSPGCGGGAMDLDEYTASRKASMIRTKVEVDRIRKALENISGWDYYMIIPMKYFQGSTLDEIAFEINLDKANVCRHKNRMIRQLAVLLFGVDGMN
jgi:DNA-directed RNA polymerase specialized sigma subunit